MTGCGKTGNVAFARVRIKQKKPKNCHATNAVVSRPWFFFFCYETIKSLVNLIYSGSFSRFTRTKSLIYPRAFTSFTDSIAWIPNPCEFFLPREYTLSFSAWVSYFARDFRIRVTLFYPVSMHANSKSAWLYFTPWLLNEFQRELVNWFLARAKVMRAIQWPSCTKSWY